MRSKIKTLFSDKYFLFAFLFFIIGLSLRFYRLGEFVTFLGDQGRDAIILRRIVTFEHFPAIGAPTSIGQVYLGPFYYYFISPWLPLFRFNPIGPAFGVAFFSSLFILVNYVIVRELFDKKTALISTVLITFSKPLIDLSRFSWNPNLMPLFSLLTAYFLIRALDKKKTSLFIVAGAFLSFSVQLHYLALLLIVPILLTIFVHIFMVRKDITNVLKKSAAMLGSFVFFSLPLFIFDLRHEFLNTKNFISLLQSTENVSGSGLFGLLDTIDFMNRFALNIHLDGLLSLLLFSLFVVLLVLHVRKKDIMATVLLFLIVLVVGISLFTGPRFPHYFGVVYPFYFIIIGYILSYLMTSLPQKFLLATFLASFIVINASGYKFLSAKPSNQIDKAEAVAETIYQNIDSEKYRLTGLPDHYSDNTYRYFLEVWGKRPLEIANPERGDELFVVCEEDCKPIGDPLWDIAYFAPTKVDGKWKVDSVSIYKLTREE